MTLASILQILRDHKLLLESQHLDESLLITGKICTDNRAVKDGDIFVCIKGSLFDGHSFIPQVRQKNAALIVCEDEFSDKLPAIRVTDSRKATALLAKLYFHNPSSRFRLIGITGTNGKTTTSTLLYKAVRELGFSAGLIGTLGYDINDQHFETHHTTPDILELNQIFADMAEQELQYVFMEVSSHALALDRVYGIEFDYCLFTNLSREHLDFHHTMEDYGSTKSRLFDRAVEHKAVALINIDDSFGSSIYDDLLARDAYVFSVGSRSASYQIRTDQISCQSSWEQSRFTLQGKELAINLRSALIGSFNIANLALSAAAMSLMGFEKRQIEQGLNSVQPIRGRFERVPNQHGVGVFVDYAHTPDAMENVLKTCRELQHRRVLCLFGAGGERDKGKRPLMLKTALQFADTVIICDDNPRFENPNDIIRDIVKGSELWLPWWIIRDRKKAIWSILQLAQPGDIVLICGKGHETYQEIESQRVHFDDVETVNEYYGSLSTSPLPTSDLVLPIDRMMLDILLGIDDHELSKSPTTYKRISTDSRSILPDSVFIALKGKNFDGHDFLDRVLQDPTVIALGERQVLTRSNYIQTQSSIQAMADLHRKYLLMFGIYKIALTGSTGKSTTKELIAQVFNAQCPTLKTEANENNLIGLCKTIARIRPEHEYAVFELGTNAFGEIAQLSDVCAPNAGLILNVGPSHLEFLENEDGVLQEKSALFARPLDIMLYDADDARFEAFSEIGNGVGYDEQADFHISTVVNQNGLRFNLNDNEFCLPYQVPYFVKNASFAIALGILRGIKVEAIAQALAQPIQLGMRMQVLNSNGYLLILDCYNANPVSMQSAIEYWASVEPKQSHYAVLGDMLELGDSGMSYHSMIAAILDDRGMENLFTVGNLSTGYHKQDSSLHGLHFATVEELISSSVLDIIPKGSVILVKGSHSIHLEKVLPYFTSEK